MTTAIKTVKRALNLIGVHSEINPADPELLSIGFDQLLDLLHGLQADEIELGTETAPLTIPAAISDEMNNRGGSDRGLYAMLARRMAPLCRVQVPKEVLDEMRLGKQDLYQRFQSPNIPNITPSKLLPRGAGSTRSGFGHTFFNGEPLADDTTA